MAQKAKKYPTNVHANQVKTAILLDLNALKQERKSRLETVLGRFLQCQELQISSALLARAVEQCSRWRRGKATDATRRIFTAHKLMAAPCGIGLPLFRQTFRVNSASQRMIGR